MDVKEVKQGEGKGIILQPPYNPIERLDGHGWKPGQSGNPKGRPKGAKTGIRARLKGLLKNKGKEAVITYLQEQGIDLGSDPSASGVIAGVLIDQGQDGDKDAIRMILDQTEIPLPRNLKIDSTVEVHTIKRVMIDVKDILPAGLIDLPVDDDSLLTDGDEGGQG